jgi:hypothetical protein
VDYDEIELWVPGELWNQNALRRLHWAQQRALVEAMRTSAKVAAVSARTRCRHEYGRIRRVAVMVQPYEYRRNGALTDTGSHYPAAKAAIDGLVDAGVLPDDGGDEVPYLVMARPIRVTRRSDEGLRIALIDEQTFSDVLLEASWMPAGDGPGRPVVRNAAPTP